MEWQYLINKKYLANQLPYDCKNCFFEGIPISTFFNDYMESMKTDHWKLEIILKEYLLYYISAPAFEFADYFEEIALLIKYFNKMNLAQMVLYTLDMKFDVFNIYED